MVETPPATDEMVLILAAYGLFMINWSLFESVLEAAIAKRVGLDVVEGNIVTAGLAFERRASILRGLLAMNNKPPGAGKLINEITQEARRNSIIHGHVFVEEDGKKIIFVKRSVEQELKANKQEFDHVSMLAHARALREKIQKLQSLLEITEEDLSEFSNIGQSLANKSATSPKPPSSTKTS